MTIKSPPLPPPSYPTAIPPLAESAATSAATTATTPHPASPHIYYNMAQTYNIPPFVSHSLHTQYTTMYKQLCELIPDESTSYATTIRNYHPFSTAAKKEPIPIFYDMIEIITSMGILLPFTAVPIKAVHVGNNQPYYHYLNIMRNATNPLHSLADKYFYFYENIGDNMACAFNYIFYDLAVEFHDLGLCNIKNYTVQFIRAVMFALKCQAEGGVCVFKISHTMHKPIVQLLYLLTGVYDKVFIVKPTSSNIIEHDRYVVCRGFCGGGGGTAPTIADEYHTKLANWLAVITQTMTANFIINMEELLCPLTDKIPLPFLYKVCDANIILGHKQLEAMEQLTYLLKNRHKIGKMEDYKRNGQNQYMNWCKKFIATGYIAVQGAAVGAAATTQTEMQDNMNK